MFIGRKQYIGNGGINLKKKLLISIVVIIVAIILVGVFNDNQVKEVPIKGSEVKGEYMNGFHLKPEVIRYKGVIITFGGSEGGCNGDIAETLAKKGYEVLALYYFGKENQQKVLNEVPIEFFQEVITYMEKECNSVNPLTIIGASKGAELALVLAEYYDEIDNLVLYAPSSHVFIGLNSSKPASSWTYNGKGLPYIDLINASFESIKQVNEEYASNVPMTFRPMYESAIKNSRNKESARIKVENYKNNIILFAGCEDKLWPSDTMAEQIKNKKPKNTDLYLYPNVGHVIGGLAEYDNLKMGGDVEESQKAKKDSDEKLYKALKSWHKKIWIFKFKQ